jgi:O-succinylbenzoate synthase
MQESGVGQAHNLALATLENFTLPGDISASARYWAEEIVEPEASVSPLGEIAILETAGRGCEVRTELVERLTARKETIRAVELVS